VVGAWDDAKVLGQTAEASIDGLPGNSGGPSLDILDNTRSRLIGVVRATDLDSGSALAIASV